MVSADQPTIIFFDDVCVLCSGVVKGLIKADRKKALRFASLAGDTARNSFGSPGVAESKSIIVLSDQKRFDKGDAVIEIFRRLGGFYTTVALALQLLPKRLRDFMYDRVAANRYRIFGRNESCLLPSEDIRDLFLP